MAIKKIHETRVGTRCAVRIYRDPTLEEFIVKTVVNGRVQGGKNGGGYFTSDKADARGTAAFEVKRLRKYGGC